jgi:hypothetical protein
MGIDEMLRKAPFIAFVVACGGGVVGGTDASTTDAKSDAKNGDASTRVPAKHRATPQACPTDRGAGPAPQPYPQNQSNGCTSDADCTAGVNGRCFPNEGLVGPGGCSYDACSNAMCGATTPCTCRASATDNTANVCDTGGNCAVDSDCGPGGYCSPSASGCGMAPYFCHTPSDGCIDDSDCPAPDPASCASFSTCAFDPQQQHWACTQFVCCPP